MGETRALLSNTHVKLETTKDQLDLMIRKIELPKVSILTEESEALAPFEPNFEIVDTDPNADDVFYSEWSVEALDLEVVPPNCPNPKFPVSARSLHTYLQIGKDFSTWMKDRIKGFKLVEDQDFGVFPNSGENPLGGRPSLEYWLTSDAAQWLAADGKSERGVEVIKYLVARNKRLAELEKVTAPQLTMTALCQAYLQQEEQLKLAITATDTVPVAQPGHAAEPATRRPGDQEAIPASQRAAADQPDWHHRGAEEYGAPFVLNGMALSKIHHAAFDGHMIGIVPDYRVHICERLLELHDGPILELGIKKMDGQLIKVPREDAKKPDRERLERRFELFKECAA